MLQIEGLTPEQCAIVARARKYSQYVKAVENALAGICVFCEMDRKKHQIFLEDEYWSAKPCNPPEDHTAWHFLLIPKRHIKSLSELDDATEGLALLQMLRQVREMHGIASSGLLCRDGDATLSAGTIPHLHLHIMVPNGTGRVESPFYKGAQAEAEGQVRAVIFERMRTGTPLDALSDDERKLIEGRV